MASRPCLGCGRLIAAGSRCGRCLWKANAAYSPKRMRGRKWMKKRAAMMRRAGWMCEGCGERIADEVHHVDGNVRNNQFENLRALCRPCHVRAGHPAASERARQQERN